jgi:hypothetical protein
MIAGRRSLLLGGAGLALGGCFDRPYYDRNAEQKAFLAALQTLAKPALASNNPLQIEEAAKQSVVLWNKIGSFTGWRGVLKVVEGNSKNAAVTLEIGPQVSLYAFNDWALAAAGNIVNSASGFFSTRSRDTPPPGLSPQAVTALKTFRIGQTVTLSGRMGEIAGSGLFDLTRLLGKGDGDNRQFLLAPRFVARVEELAASD